ncbi:MAG: DNA cytosine methyltransferase [Magnetococcales bacterium]|nr:DNA cytosine methyltransferase [Magnetococcales bacterium]
MSADADKKRIDAAIRRKLARLARGDVVRVVDLFSGCGGFSLGFKRAGFGVVAGIDLDPEAAASHAVNFHGKPMPRNRTEREIYSADITQLSPARLAKNIGGKRSETAEAVDVLIGGPPCQAYARVGRAKLREVNEHPNAFKVDPRGNLYLRYIAYVRALRPLVLVMENVPDVLNFGGHNIAEETAEVLEKLGYNCRYTLLNAAHFGVPQMRERMFLIGYHRCLRADVTFPRPTHHIELPAGYHGARGVALKHLGGAVNKISDARYVPPPEPRKSLPPAITAEDALADIPPITAHLEGNMKRGIRKLDDAVPYLRPARTDFERDMRAWEGLLPSTMATAHVIRSLPRDYRIFRAMKAGDEYPQAQRLAVALFEEHLRNLLAAGSAPKPGTVAFNKLRALFVPPYDAGKFPNKWRKMEPDMPARTVMAHLGKDSYSHIHYDCKQARTISVREAARLQSFPDSFVFVGAMNAAFRQIGNAVPPLMSFALANEIMRKAIKPLRQRVEAISARKP